ncbi:MAG: hypothetical protein WC878_06665 [Candidatus Paceibacterota bacterium]
MPERQHNENFSDVEFEEWESVATDKKYETFELWENLQDLRKGTTELLAKGFLEKIRHGDTRMKKYIFYTTGGFTFQSNSNAIYPDVENCQILGWTKGYNPKKAFEFLKKECPWLCGSTFNEVIASELKSEKTYHFNLKN